MRKFILSAVLAATAAAGLGGAASAQSAGELRHNDRVVREQQRDLRDARRYGDRHDVRDARRDLREARQERREDWRDYRETHRDVFRGPRYAGPQGYHYRPVAPGHRLQPEYYGRRYAISDYGRYRLPHPGAARYVRYGNDVLLVNPRNGNVLRSYNGFFY